MNRMMIAIGLLSSLSGFAASDDARTGDVELAMKAEAREEQHQQATVSPIEAEQLLAPKLQLMQKQLDSQLQNQFSETLEKEVF